jgi:glycosyltransferase involved in cell wall biosynthesis
LGRRLTSNKHNETLGQSCPVSPRDMAGEPSPRTILFFDHTAEMGGGEFALLHLVKALNRDRYSPIVVLACDGPLNERLQAAQIPTLVLPLSMSVIKVSKDSLGGRSLLQIGAMLRILRYIVRLRRVLQEYRVDLVHTNSLKADLIGGIAGRLAGVRVLWHVRDRIADDYLPPQVARLFRRLCHMIPHVVVANSQATIMTLGLPAHRYRPDDQWQGVGNCYVVHDGVPEGATLAHAPQSMPSPHPLVGLVGRISPWKGQHVFIQAAERVHRRFPTARFQIIGAPLFGEEEYAQQVRNQVKDLGLTDCVEFLGFRTDVPELMQALDVLVHASTIGEPFGQVVIEGMAAGKPVIATNGGGVPEIIEDGVTGLLAPMGDAAALAERMERLLADPQMAQAMGVAGRERVQSHFTVAHTARKIERVYDRTLNITPGLPNVAKAQSPLSSLSSDG